MPEGWRRVPLGAVAQLDVERVRVRTGEVYRIAGVLNSGQGVFEREPLDGAATSYQALHRLRAGQLVMRKLTAWEGPITTVPARFDGFCVSPEFPTYSLSKGLDPDFMRLICQLPSFWDAMRSRSAGTVQRRKRVNPDQLLRVEIDLPPIAEQRRIVDLMSALDAATASSRALVSACEVGLSAVRESWTSAAPMATLSSVLLGIDAGRSPDAQDRIPSPSEVGVLKISAIRPGRFDPAQVKTVPDPRVFPAVALVRAGDVLMTRANTSQLVGQVCRVDSVPPSYYLSDKTLRLRFDSSRADSEYMVEALTTASVRRQIELVASGTSASMKNISQESIRRLMVPLPSLEQQEQLAGATAAIWDVARRSETCVGRLETVRATVLSRLLSGRDCIPASYDRFLGEAA